MASVVSERYALSLYELARESRLEQSIFQQLFDAVRIFEDYPDLMKILQTPSISLPEKTVLLRKVFGGSDPLLLNFLMLLTEKRRISLLPEMVRVYKDQHYLAEGICEVQAVTALPLSAALHEKLRVKMSAVTGKKVVLLCSVDPTILGGVLVKVRNNQIDASIKTQLQELAQQLIHIIA